MGALNPLRVHCCSLPALLCWGCCCLPLPLPKGQQRGLVTHPSVLQNQGLSLVSRLRRGNRNFPNIVKGLSLVYFLLRTRIKEEKCVTAPHGFSQCTLSGSG